MFIFSIILANFTFYVFSVLEAYLPRYFKGAKDIFYSSPELNDVGHSINKPNVSSVVRNMIEKNLTKEIEFYKIVCQRLIKQSIAIQ